MKPPGRMSQTERNELRRVVKGRFDLLRKELDQRESEYVEAERARVYAEHYDAMDEARRSMDRLAREAQAFEEEWAAEERRLSDLGLVNKATANYHYGIASVNVRVNWQPIAVEKATERAVARARVEVKAAGLQIERMQQEMMEEIAVDALASDAARDFLGRIPTADRMLPIVHDPRLLTPGLTEGGAS